MCCVWIHRDNCIHLESDLFLYFISSVISRTTSAVLDQDDHDTSLSTTFYKFKYIENMEPILSLNFGISSILYPTKKSKKKEKIVKLELYKKFSDSGFLVSIFL